MKKIISIIAILLCFATSYGQDTKPTKQETMDWIANKMKQYIDKDYTFKGGKSKRYFQSYSNGKFVYEIHTYGEDDETFCGYVLVTIHLDKITKINTILNLYEDRQDNITKTYRRLIAYGNNIITKDYKNYYKTRCEYDGSPINDIAFGKWSDDDSESNDAIFRFDLESGLRERAIKALENLIEYNIGKSEKKEVY